MDSTGNRKLSTLCNAKAPPRCGSICGEVYAFSRQRNSCTLRKHSHAGRLSLDRKFLEAVAEGNFHGFKGRFNTCFHDIRFIIVAFGGISTGLMMVLRYSITVAILNMVNQTALYLEAHPGKTEDDFIAEGYNPGGEFNWDNGIQQLIMSWYMIAYTLPQVSITKLAKRVGFRYSIPISLLVCAVSTLLIPPAAYIGWQWVVVLRLVHGIGASAILPLLLGVIENWMRWDEISLGLTCAQVVQATLTAANPLVAGYLSNIHWRYTFFVPGVATVIFCAIWLAVVTETPDDNWLISENELEYICGCNLDATGKHTIPHGIEYEHETTKPSVNVINVEATSKAAENLEATHRPGALDIFKKPISYAYPIIWIFYSSSQACFNFILPTYLGQFLKLDIGTNGFYCFLIMSGTVISVLWPHSFLNLLEKQFKLSLTTARRITFAIICIMVASTWFYVGLFHNAQLIMFFINRCFHSSHDVVATSAIMSNYSKSGLSSVAFSISNAVGNLSVVFASALVGYVLDFTEQSVEGWTIVFLGLGGVQLIVMAIFCSVVKSEPIEFKLDYDEDKISKEFNDETTFSEIKLR